MLKSPNPNDLSARILSRKKALKLEQIQYVTCSQWLAETARQSHFLQNASVTAIPNPIDTQVFSPGNSEEITEWRRQMGISTETRVLLFAAMKITDERKGFAFLEKALALLRQQTHLPNIELLVMGNPGSNPFQHLPFKVHTTGHLSDTQQIARVYAMADLFIIPSLEDNLPNTVLESMACGTPVVGFRTGGIPEMVDHQQNGYIATYKDQTDLANGIKWMLEQPDYPHFRTKAREKVKKAFSENIVADRYTRIYSNLLNRNVHQSNI